MQTNDLPAEVIRRESTDNRRKIAALDAIHAALVLANDATADAQDIARGNRDALPLELDNLGALRAIIGLAAANVRQARAAL